MLNVICTAGLWARYRRIARDSSALVVRGSSNDVTARSTFTPTGSNACRSRCGRPRATSGEGRAGEGRAWHEIESVRASLAKPTDEMSEVGFER